MGSLTQTIPNYVGGISEQPDEQKFPGQVKNIQNAIPDVTYGLYKRPGAKRIGATPLTNVQSGGSWFHYYRDATEGSYIGQVAADGKVRVWSCNDGTEKNVWYATDNAAYNAGTASHTSITSYLTPSPSTDSEDIQALTINDTTFLNNRSKTVGTTGTTDARPDTHFAFIEILRTENGRQYALNLYDTETTSNITRATRVKISSDNLSSANSTGHCPGIGTQVFSGTETNTGSKKNLTFRLTTLGQQGKSGNDNNVEDYKCTYNREITLLHGGEDWTSSDSTTVTLDSATTSYTYTVGVTEHETVAVKANIKAVRPAPTPFDADTAVTADTVIGGIQSEISGTNITATQIGTGLYLSRGSAFNVEVLDNDLMRVMQGTVNDVTRLPVQCKHGYIVKVSNTRMSEEDDYFVRFYGENDKDGAGIWKECPEPGIIKSFDAATMPHIIQRQADGDFLVKQFVWSDRTIGDNITNPLPSFVGQTINKVLFFRNRLVFLSGENVITSRPGTIDEPNFWNTSALTVGVNDPVDISCASLYPSELFDALEINTGLLCFSTNQQFLLSSDDTVFNPDTAKLRIIGNHNYNKVIPPLRTTQTGGFVDNSFKYSRFMELGDVKREGEPLLVDTTKVVPTLLSKDIDLLTQSIENNTVFFGKTDSDIVTGFRYLRIGDSQQQSSWFKWKLNNPLKYHFAIEDTYYFLDKDNFLQSINLVQADADPSIEKDSINYLLHLDNYTTVSGGSFDAATNKTTFSNVTWIPNVTTPNGSLVVVDSDSGTSREGRYAECTLLGNSPNDDFTVPGDWSSATVYIGYLYEFKVEFPRIYLQKQEGRRVVSDVNSKLTVHRIKLNFGKIGLYETTLSRVGKSDYTEVHESTFADYYDVSDAPYVSEEVKTIPVYDKNENVDITLKSSHPAPAVLRSVSWEGDYSQKFYRRV